MLLLCAVVALVTLTHAQESLTRSQSLSASPVKTRAAALLSATHPLSRSATRSITKEPTPGTLEWLNADGVFSSTFVPRIVDRDLRVRNHVLTGRIVGDKFRPNATNPRRFANITVREEVAVQARGLMRRMSEGSVITASSFQLGAPDPASFTLTLFADDFFEVRRDERVTLEFLGNVTDSGLRTANELEFVIAAFVYPPDQTSEAIVMVGGVTSALASIVGGIPGSTEVHALTMMLAMSCVDKEIAAYGGGTSDYVLSPLPYSTNSRGRLSGNVGFVVYVLCLHLLFYKIVRINTPTMRISELWERTRFPSLPYGLNSFMFPGFCFFTVRSSYDIVDGGVTVVVLLLCLLRIFTTFFSFKYISSQRSFLDRRYHFSDERDTKRSCCESLYVPRGRWAPAVIVGMYRSVIGELDSANENFVYVGVVFSSLMGVTTGISPSSRDSCKLQFSALTFFFAGFFLLYALKRPFRFAVQNYASALNCVCLLMVAASSIEPRDETPTVFKIGVIVVVLCTLARGLFGAIMIFNEMRSGEPSTTSVVGDAAGGRGAVQSQYEAFRDTPFMDDVESHGTSTDTETELEAERGGGFSRR